MVLKKKLSKTMYPPYIGRAKIYARKNSPIPSPVLLILATKAR